MTPAQNTAAYIQGFEDGKRTAKAEFANILAEQPPQRKPLTDKQRRTIVAKLSEADYADGDEWDSALIDEVEAAHGIKE